MTIPFSAWVYAALYGAVIVGSLPGLAAVQAAAVGLTALFIGLEFRRVPRNHQIAGLVLSVAGLGAAWAAGRLGSVFIDGVTRAQIFMLLFAAVSWLKIPARHSPSLQAVGRAVARQPPGRRFTILSLTAHGLGAVLNFAALPLLTTMVESQTGAAGKRRMTQALMQGFCSASCWSPFYVSMAVILTVLDGVRWPQVAPAGLLIGLTIVGIGWVMDRLGNRAGAAISAGAAPLGASPGGAGGGLSGRTAGHLASHLGLLFIAVVGLLEATGLSIPVCLGLVAPPFAFFWLRTIWPAETGVAGRLGRAFMAGLAGLRVEAVLFVSANLFGLGIAAVIPPELVARLLAFIAPGPDAVVFVLIIALTACAAIGLHPVLLVVLAAEVLPPAVIGLPAPLLALVLLAVWALNTVANPFSATALYMSRVTGVSGWTIAWRWNGPFAAVAALLVASLVVLIRRLAF